MFQELEKQHEQSIETRNSLAYLGAQDSLEQMEHGSRGQEMG